MDSIPVEVKKRIEDFITSIKDDGIKVNKVVLFGSYAKGEAREDSDIDLCVVSDDFGKDRISEMQYLFKKATKIDPRIEAIPFSSNRFSYDDNSPMIYLVKKEGIIMIEDLP